MITVLVHHSCRCRENTEMLLSSIRLLWCKYVNKLIKGNKTCPGLTLTYQTVSHHFIFTVNEVTFTHTAAAVGAGWTVAAAADAPCWSVCHHQDNRNINCWGRAGENAAVQKYKTKTKKEAEDLMSGYTHWTMNLHSGWICSFISPNVQNGSHQRLYSSTGQKFLFQTLHPEQSQANLNPNYGCAPITILLWCREYETRSHWCRICFILYVDRKWDVVNFNHMSSCLLLMQHTATNLSIAFSLYFTNRTKWKQHDCRLCTRSSV